MLYFCSLFGFNHNYSSFYGLILIGHYFKNLNFIISSDYKFTYLENAKQIYCRNFLICPAMILVLKKTHIRAGINSEISNVFNVLGRNVVPKKKKKILDLRKKCIHMEEFSIYSNPSDLYVSPSFTRTLWVGK